MSEQEKAPAASRSDVWDTYPGGHAVHDPYRWLEDEAQAAPWVFAQNQATEAYLDTIKERAHLRQRLAAAFEYNKTGCTFASGTGPKRRYYHPRRAAADNQPCLMISSTAGGEASVFLDANMLSADGSSSLGVCALSVAGKWCAYGVAIDGSDMQTIRVRHVESREDMPDKLEGVGSPGCIAWRDEESFFYTCFFAASDLRECPGGSTTDHFSCNDGKMAVFYHVIGTPQRLDAMVFDMPGAATRLMSAQVTNDGAYLLVTVTKAVSTENESDHVLLWGRRLFLSGQRRSVSIIRTPADAGKLASHDTVGIGVSFCVCSGLYVVSRTDANSGARLAGLTRGEVLVSVAGFATRGLSANELVGALKGPAHTSVDVVLESTYSQVEDAGNSSGARSAADMFVAPVEAALSSQHSQGGFPHPFTRLGGLGFAEYVSNQGPVMFLRTNHDAERCRLVSVDLTSCLGCVASAAPLTECLTDVISHQSNYLASVVCVASDFFIATYLLQGTAQKASPTRGGAACGCLGAVRQRSRPNRIVDAVPPATSHNDNVGDDKYRACCHTLEIFTSAGVRLMEVPLPGMGSITQVSAQPHDREFFFSWESFTHPPATFVFDMDKMKCRLLRQDLGSTIQARDFEARQVFYPSKDGAMIPMFVISARRHVHAPDTLALLSAYGGFAFAETPRYNALQLAFIREFGAIVAVAGVRGGGEYGSRWHMAGCNNNGVPGLLHKQTGIDDLEAAAEYLISSGCTRPSKLAISGTSNGGLLVAASANQRPDLFSCVVPRVGLMDMLRFHRFTIGHAWCPEYGCADRSEHEFQALHSISPLHNIPSPLEGSDEGRRQTPFPAVLAVTGIRDDRVVPHHSFKYIAQVPYP
jgi:prolyl oligopeptidase PreP (S9A serine peptidase family)